MRFFVSYARIAGFHCRPCIFSQELDEGGNTPDGAARHAALTVRAEKIKASILASSKGKRVLIVTELIYMGTQASRLVQLFKSIGVRADVATIGNLENPYRNIVRQAEKLGVKIEAGSTDVPGIYEQRHIGGVIKLPEHPGHSIPREDTLDSMGLARTYGKELARAIAQEYLQTHPRTT